MQPCNPKCNLLFRTKCIAQYAHEEINATSFFDSELVVYHTFKDYSHFNVRDCIYNILMIVAKNVTF